jgi:hypothetical protein
MLSYGEVKIEVSNGRELGKLEAGDELRTLCRICKHERGLILNVDC